MAPTFPAPLPETNDPQKPSAKGKAPDTLPLGSPDFYPSPEHPTGWRGDGTGRYPAATPPTSWERKGGKNRNVRWIAGLPAGGFSSPILVGSKLFLTCDPNSLVCIDKDSGKIIWVRSTLAWYAAIDDELHAPFAVRFIRSGTKSITLSSNQPLTRASADPVPSYQARGVKFVRAEVSASGRSIRLWVAEPLPWKPGEHVALNVAGLKSAAAAAPSSLSSTPAAAAAKVATAAAPE